MLSRGKTGRWLLTGLLLISCLVLVSCSGNPPKDEGAQSKDAEGSIEEKMKVAFIYFGPVGDHGWTYQHELGRKYVEEKLPYVETVGLENVPTGADAERILTDLAKQGYKVIIATSFDYQESTLRVAKEFPDTIFLNSTGDKIAQNVGAYFGREYEGFYLNGVMAGLMTKSNVLGFIASYPIPPVFQDANAFLLGARAVNPNARVKLVWLNTWYDPAAEREAAMSLIDAGADVIAHETDSPAPHQVAQERGVFSVGKNSDMSKFAPKAFLTGTVWKWGTYYVRVLEEIKKGTWKPEAYWGHIGEGIFEMAPYGESVPQEVAKIVDEYGQKLTKGENIFQGPLSDTKGQPRVEKGKALNDEELRRLDWLIDGIETTGY